jgi:endonuclease III
MTSRRIGHVLRRLQREQAAWRETTLAQVQRETADPFQILIACILSLRTKDEVTAVASARLFHCARTPRALRKISQARIARTIYPVGFYRMKAATIHAVCEQLLAVHAGRVPDTLDTLLTLPGVGRKTANLVLTLGFHKPGICVDVHVHRISNRWSLVKTKTPEETEHALRACLPRRYWIAYNDMLVSFGQTICRPTSPWCSRCPVRHWCPQRGVTRHR